MTTDFSFKRDFKIIDWKNTLILNLVRSVAAGIVWGIIMFVVAMGNGGGEHFFKILPVLIMYPLLFPLSYLIFCLPMGLVAGFLSSRGIPFVGWIAAFFSLFIAVGDPLVFFFHKYKPQLVPVDKPGFFNFRIIIFVLREIVPEGEAAT